MKAGRIVAALTLASALGLGGCHRKPKAQPPAAAQPPVITEPEPPPTPTPETQPQPPILPPPATATVKPPPTKSKHKPKVAKKPSPPATKEPSKTVVENGGSKGEGQLSAAIPNDEAIHQRLNAAQLQEATEANLKSINRQLTNDEQTTVQQIRGLLQQSRAASTAGDTERAYNLAFKAHLLSDELVKPK